MKDKIISALKFRHACKEFDPAKKISEDDFNIILETAHLSPSSFGLEPWQFLVVQNMDLREKIREVTWGGKKQLPTASHFVIILYKKAYFMRFNSDYLGWFMKNVQNLPDEAIFNRSKFIETFQKSDFELMDDRALNDWASKQTYIPLANMMTVAALLQIDSCPIEGFVAKDLEKILAKDFNINMEQFGVSCMVAFGFRVNEQKPKTRQPIEDVIKWYN
ncbi:MAG: NAD(P)H-dependent oxidoreductase [Opitutaceae bacterium]|nr:NAD(P)H-dependent oxidoreductase [Cytophagales bacterium]